MPKTLDERVTAQIEGDFVVFLIGMRINKFWKVHKWFPAAKAMSAMLAELSQIPVEDSGFLGVTNLGTGGMVQYWRSFEHLEAYAKNQNQAHFPAWGNFNRLMKNARGDVGIWHETYLVRAGEYENVYSGMPPFGLGKAVGTVPATGSKNSARQRLGS